MQTLLAVNYCFLLSFPQGAPGMGQGGLERFMDVEVPPLPNITEA